MEWYFHIIKSFTIFVLSYLALCKMVQAQAKRTVSNSLPAKINTLLIGKNG
jgi:hypothetical protein